MALSLGGRGAWDLIKPAKVLPAWMECSSCMSHCSGSGCRIRQDSSQENPSGMQTIVKCIDFVREGRAGWQGATRMCSAAKLVRDKSGRIDGCLVGELTNLNNAIFLFSA